MKPTLRKPFVISIEGAQGTGKTTLYQALRAKFSKAAVQDPCLLLDSGYVGPQVRVMQAADRSGELDYHLMWQWAKREIQLLEEEQLAYVWLDVVETLALADRTGKPLVDLDREVAGYRTLMGERSCWATVLRFDPFAYADQDEFTAAVLEQLTGQLGVPYEFPLSLEGAAR